MTKVSKEDIYRRLTEMHGWTADQIATMNPHIQFVYLTEPTIQTFSGMDAFSNWQASRK